MRSACFPAALFIFFTSLLAGSTSGNDLLVNGDFSKWDDSVPQGWRVEIGAQNGQGPESSIERIDDSGLSLTGNAATRRWKSVSQSFVVEPGGCYRLKFEARARDLTRIGRQFDNCYVGLFAKDAGGKVVDRQFHTVSATDWTGDTLVFAPPSQAKTGEVVIFLSKSGSLQVRSAALESLAAKDSFRVLVDEMDRHYSFFAPKQIPWGELAARYSAQAEEANSAEVFVAVIQPMLKELRDLHVTIRMPDGRQLPTYAREYQANYDFKYIAGKLKHVEQIGKIGFTGRGAGDVGYVAVGSLAGDEQTFRGLEQAIEALLDAPGLIVDLRGNQGGDETRARRIASLFTDKSIVYAKSQIRSGPRAADLTPPHDRLLEPRETGKPYLRPVVCLLGPGCISSGEGMALMFRALPHVQTMGQPTAGASGNPAPLPLPNGVIVSYSRWLSLTPDGELIEGTGVVPKVVVQTTPPGDSTFDAAVDLISKQVAAE